MIHKDYCSHCKTKTGPFVKTGRYKDTQYYYCRKCKAKIMRKYYHNDKKDKFLAINRKGYWKSPEKMRARSAVKYATKVGKLVRPPICEKCGIVGKIEGHHMDYSRPLEVLWLCTSCHSDYK